MCSIIDYQFDKLHVIYDNSYSVTYKHMLRVKPLIELDLTHHNTSVIFQESNLELKNKLNKKRFKTQ